MKDESQQPVQSADQLLNEPQPVAPTPMQPAQPTVAPPVEPPKKRHRVRNIILILLAVVVVVMTASVVYYLSKAKVSVDDLVTETTADVSYLRPKQWSPIHIEDFHGYGDMQGRDGKSTAMVFTRKSTDFFEILETGLDEATYDLIRDGAKNGPIVKSAESVFKNVSSECTDDNITSTSETDTVKTSTTVGLLKITATCKTSTVKATIKMRVVAGNDGHLRLIAILASDSYWNLNAESYQKMLYSLETPNK